MKKKITDFIVNHCYVVLAVMVGIAGLSAIVSQNVKINHDIMKYMPESSETTQGKKIMDEEFGDVATSNYTIMFENLDDSEKDSMKDYFESVSGVNKVNYDDTKDYNLEKDGIKYTLYSIEVEGEADADNAKNVYNEIHDHLKNQKEGAKNRYTFYEKGDVATSNGSVLNIAIILIAVGVAMLIITLMSESFIEPWLYLTSILIAVLINKGTNIIFPSVSHITNSIAAILQLALSMDYSIMLAERYRQEREKDSNKKEAMRAALSHAFGSISASSVTTIVGLIVLIFMSFTIGRDMGLVLSKGVLLSLISIFATLPAFLLFFDKWIMNSKKKAPRFDMTFLGRFANFTRHIAGPVFLLILFGSMILKGNVGIEYTGANNNKIGEIFDETNQIAIIYDNSDEARIAKICKDYDNVDKVKEALCFGNTIGEPEKYDELKAKADDLGADMNVDDYLIKTLYYHYYDPNETNKMTLEEFVNFIQQNIMNDENFKDDVDSNMKSKIERLSNFVVFSKMNQEKSLGELAEIFEMNEGSLRKVMVLYGNNERNSDLGKAVTNSRVTLSEFVNFMNNKVLKDPEYSEEVSSAAKTKLNQLQPFLNKNSINAKTDAAGLAEIFGVEKSSVEKIFQYEAYLNHIDEITEMQNTAKAKIETAVREKIASLVEDKITELVTEKVTNTYIETGHMMTDEEKLAYINTIKETVTEQVTTASKDTVVSAVTAAAQPQIEAATNAIMAQITTEAASIKNSPVGFVDFILAHQNDEKVAPNLNTEIKTKLNLAKTVMSAVNSDKKFTSSELAGTFGLDQNQLRLLYALNYFENINRNPKMSIKTLVAFLNESVVNDAKYGKELSGDQRQTLSTVTDLMHRSIENESYDSKAMFNLLSSLSGNLKKNLVDLLYMYHGSLYHYDNNWTMSIEQFVNYLHGTILKDNRFSDKIDVNKRADIEKANDKIADAKKLLVGKNHSRAILNTTLAEEGEETFAFIEKLKSDIDSENAHVFVIGNSPMAYEMSKTFNDEMNFITILTMISIFVVVAFTFRSLLIPSILILIIQSAVWITMSILSITGSSVYFIAIIIVQAILMGATIDYAILYTNYYLEHRKKKLDIKKALIESYNKSVPTIITSASVLVIVTYIVGSFDKQGSAIAAKICVTVSEGTLCAAIIILLILPALLATCDKIILRRKSE
ncbi:MMPL family transporter [Candidatus Saccharibacteria bacterium]|nr:MMPL family transporter [Candidatus Saccharibacteria bacterium]